MRIRVRGPEGQSTATVADTATVGDLLSQLSKSTSIDRLEIKYGYPPKPLRLGDFEASVKLSDTGISFDGEQLIVSRASGGADQLIAQESAPKPEGSRKGGETPSNKASQDPTSQRSSFAFAGLDAPPPQPPVNETPESLSLSRKAPSTEPPELALPSHGACLTLRIMPDDNSCLFRAFGTACLPGTDNMHELRAIVAARIQSHPDTYPAVVLDKHPDEYCRWIQSADAWGGAIELDILSRHFDLEICSVDVQTCRVDRFNEGRPQRCILVYSGIHYDTIALSPSDPPFDRAYAPPEFDTKVFDAADDAVLQKAVELCAVLQGRHYFTDTAKYSVRCNLCGKTFRGEKGATEHAKRTGHYDFGEAGEGGGGIFF